MIREFYIYFNICHRLYGIIDGLEVQDFVFKTLIFAESFVGINATTNRILFTWLRLNVVQYSNNINCITGFALRNFSMESKKKYVFDRVVCPWNDLYQCIPMK